LWNALNIQLVFIQQKFHTFRWLDHTASITNTNKVMHACRHQTINLTDHLTYIIGIPRFWRKTCLLLMQDRSYQEWILFRPIFILTSRS